MNVLAIDTASELTSVALLVDGDVVVSQGHRDPRRHAEAIGPLLAQVRPSVDPAALTAVACGVGPGPYTGLRVGIAAALALGAAWRVPVVGVCSLDAVALAAQGITPGPVGVALDARRREVYWAAYDAAGVRIAGPRVGPAAAIDAALRAGRWAGAGARVYADELGQVVTGEPASEDEAVGVAERLAFPHAVDVARLAAAALAAGASVAGGEVSLDAHGEDSGATAEAMRGAVLLPPRPLYLRRPDVTVPGGVR